MTKTLQTLRIIHLALPVGIIMFGIVTLTFDRQVEPNPTLSIMAIAVTTLALAAGLMIPPLLLKKLKNIKPQTLDATNIVAIIQRYQSYKIIQWALIEMGTFFSLAIFYITGDMATLGAASAGLILLFLSPPTASQIQKSAEITPEEWQRLEN